MKTFLVVVLAVVLVKVGETRRTVPNVDVEDLSEETTPNCSRGRCDQLISSCSGVSCTQTSCSGECGGCPSGRCCDGSNCNICYGGGCCRTRTCNNCFRQCRSSCQYSSCYNSCYGNCLQGRSNCHHNDISCGGSGGEQTVVNVGGTKGKRIYNVTTLINITNLINNTNEIDAPINVNTTNLNNVELNATSFNRNTGDTPISPDGHENCCYILHPLECRKDNNGTQICTRKRKKHCGPICLAQQTPNPKCYNIPQYPYVYCPGLTQPNCGSCYNCPGIAPTQCAQTPACPQICRQALMTAPMPSVYTMPQQQPHSLPYPQMNQQQIIQHQQPVIQHQQPIIQHQQPFIQQQQPVYTMAKPLPPIHVKANDIQTQTVLQNYQQSLAVPSEQGFALQSSQGFSGLTLPAQTYNIPASQYQTLALPVQTLNLQPSQGLSGLNLQSQGLPTNVLVLKSNDDGSSNAQNLEYLTQLLKLAAQAQNSQSQPEIVQPVFTTNNGQNGDLRIVPVEANAFPQFKTGVRDTSNRSPEKEKKED